MATYKGIQGTTVQKLATDPTASEAAGQLWYNSTSGAFKVSVAGAGAWSSGNNLNTGSWTIINQNDFSILFEGKVNYRI